MFKCFEEEEESTKFLFKLHLQLLYSQSDFRFGSTLDAL